MSLLKCFLISLGVISFFGLLALVAYLTEHYFGGYGTIAGMAIDSILLGTGLLYALEGNGRGSVI